MEYQKFRWFFTSSEKLVIGGKNAEQNEQIINQHLNKNDLVLHTEMPGSPFCVIKSDGKSNISQKDIKETAIFCACFSKAWKKNIQNIVVHSFKPEQIRKSTRMKKGSFLVKGKVKVIKVKLKLFLVKQKGKIRAVAFSKNSYSVILPGKVPKEKTAEKLAEKINVKKEEIMQALPAGGFKI